MTCLYQSRSDPIMKKFFNPKSLMLSFARKRGLRLGVIELLLATVMVFTAAGVVPQLVSQAQILRTPVRVSNLAVQSSPNTTKVSITADGALIRNQSWQDAEGYHLVFPNTVALDSLNKVRGVQIRRLGSSLEVLLQTKPDARISLQSDGNSLNISVEGKLQSRADWERSELKLPEEERFFEEASRRPSESSSATVSSTSENPVSSSSSVDSSNQVAENRSPDYNLPTATATIPQSNTPSAATLATDPSGAQIDIHEEESGVLASVFSGTGVLIVMSLGLVGLLVSRKVRSRQVSGKSEASKNGWNDSEEPTDFQTTIQQAGSDNSLVRVTQPAPANGSSRQAVVRMPASGPTSLYGAYRIDQEVGKLLFGQPHRLDVLSSRAGDDRRAIETSLIKGVNSPEIEESARRRAREALEEYGFVARQCATLLLAPDAFDRTSAARALGEIKSPAALPFLLEGLYDSESIVRNQAVVSIGELKIPKAIGALLDIARTHPDVPSALLSRTLSACSVEGLDFFDAVSAEPALLGAGYDNSGVADITQLEPSLPFEPLPESSDDEELARALTMLASDNVDERAAALTMLTQFRVRSAVDAVAAIVVGDSWPNIRSQAITTLGAINHESVFASVLLGMADDTREVRAAAARTLNRLNVERADAYARVIESGDEQTIQNVARACIDTGIVSQNLDRLADTDRQHAYETFALICLLAKARMNAPVLDAIAEHPKMEVRTKLVHLIGCTGQPEVFDQLRELAVRDGMPEELKTILLEAMYKLDQARKRVEEEQANIESEPSDQEMNGFDGQTELGFGLPLGPETESTSEFIFESNSEMQFGLEEQPKLDEPEF